MAITLSDHAIPGAPLSARLTPPQVWGIVLLAPYLLVFLAFVVYPVGYGLWLARHPESYVALYNDPIFARAALNTLIFLLIGINIKMLIALFLSGFFAQQRTWIKWLSVLFILNGCRYCSSCPGRCRRSRPFCRCASCSIPNGA